MKTIVCRFCSKNEERAKEHILPKWLQDYILGNLQEQFYLVHLSKSCQPYSTRKQSGNKLVYGQICRNCNGGWMSQLEVDFKSIFIKLNNDFSQIKALSKTERHIVNRWVFKTILMINAGTNYRKIIPDEHYQFFYERKYLPANVKIDFTYINNDETIYFEQSNITIGINKSNTKPWDNLDDSYVISLQINNIGIRVTYKKDLKLEYSEINYSNIYTQRLWPYSKNGTYSPFRNYHDSLTQFHDKVTIIKHKS